MLTTSIENFHANPHCSVEKIETNIRNNDIETNIRNTVKMYLVGECRLG
jgi:hypothetical protein